MELYRYVNQQELDSIKNDKVLAFKHPSVWSVHESLFTQLFVLDEKERIKMLRKIIRTFLSSTYYKEEYKEKKENLYYDLYTDISVIIHLSYYTYSLCWTTLKDDWVNTQIENSPEHVAYIIADIEPTSEPSITLKDRDGNTYNGILRTKEILYGDFCGSERVKTVIDRFENDGRHLSDLITILPTQWSKQHEYRQIITPNFYDLRGVSSFGGYIFNKYGGFNSGNETDLIEALSNDIFNIKDYVDKLFADKPNKILYWEIPDGFIKGIKYK